MTLCSNYSSVLQTLYAYNTCLKFDQGFKRSYVEVHELIILFIVMATVTQKGVSHQMGLVVIAMTC